MSVFISELVAFVLIIAIIWRYVVPLIRTGMAAQQAKIADQMNAAEEAKLKLAEAEAEYQKALADARSQAAQIRENARAEAQNTIEEQRVRAQEESARIVARGEEQLVNQRGAVVRELHAELGSHAVELSEKIVSQWLADEAQARATVDAFLADLEADLASDLGPDSNPTTGSRA